MREREQFYKREAARVATPRVPTRFSKRAVQEVQHKAVTTFFMGTTMVPGLVGIPSALRTHWADGHGLRTDAAPRRSSWTALQ